ncbi:MAG: polysaccharide deacetylase family protein, partial [Bacteroidaceae bacterium]|nr:polysaccharide deacetylase family protein [Bacteroidaceae bacterium]
MWILAVVLLICVLAFSARYPWWFFPKKGLVVLMYHHIGENKDRWYVSQKTFAKQLDVLIKNNFVPISFEDLNKAYQGLSDLPKKPVLITFDDGWLDNYTQAFPVLKNKNIKANIFLTYNFIDSGKDYMTWHHIIEMQ